MNKPDTLLLTLAIDEASQLYFNKLRRDHFPAERNFLDAHIMLFHQLPSHEPLILADIAAITSNNSVFNLLVSGIKNIGNGVAYQLESDILQALHKQLQKQWAQWLIPQDRHKLWPHITIQNKVRPQVAKALLLDLSAGFEPFKIQAKGLSLWEYQGGPWQFLQHFKFSG